MKVRKFVNQRDFSCNVFICSSDKGNFIVDLGYYDQEIRDYLKSLSSVDFVLQTHGHFDHIMGLNAFSEDFPEVPVYIFDKEVEVAADAYKNGSILLLGESFVPSVTFKTFGEGRLSLGKFNFQVIFTPGHTQGSCMFFLSDENLLFTGDTLLETSIGRTDLPTGDEAALFRSLNKFKKLNLFDEETKVYFGHGQDYTYKYLMKHNTFLFN